jgi:hypothetical protein
MTYGFSGLNKNLNSNRNNGFNIGTALKTGTIIIPARVISIVLNETHPKFLDLGEWNALGAIEYELVENPNTNQQYPIAYPLSPNVKNYPLVNEIVYLISLPNDLIGETNVSKRPYYINIVSLWNHPHHNAYPSLANESDPPQQKDYIQTQAGNTKVVTNENKQIFLGETFKEKTNIHPLLPFEGDVIQEGRWGNSIRFGSTVAGSPSPTITNNWSSTGNNGDPITILRNGQGERTEEGWIPITEDINNDDSSIYLTSTQKVPLEAASTSYVSYKKTTSPTTPNAFSGQQILLNSGRLVFNAGIDHMLLSSAKSINLNSLESVNVDTPSVIIQSKNIYLGSYSADEPLLKGNLTVNVLQNLITAVKQLNDTFRNLQTQPIVSLGQPVSLDMSMRLASITLNTTLIDIEKQLKDLTSKYNFTI